MHLLLLSKTTDLPAASLSAWYRLKVLLLQNGRAVIFYMYHNVNFLS